MEHVFCGGRRTASGTAATRLGRIARVIRVPLLAAALFFGAFASNAMASSGGNFVATGHDMDLHCAFGASAECQYFKITLDKVRNGSSLPILALDQGSAYMAGGELPAALSIIGEGPVVTVDPTSASFASMPFVDANGNPLYSAIVTASDYSCGGCDNTPAGESAINARSADFATYFNAGGGIMALSGAGNNGTYYNFVPLNVAGIYTYPPYSPTADGAALGVTSTMTNCCATHNSFATVPSGLVALETDQSGHAETIAAFNATITTGDGGGGFSSGPTDTTPPVFGPISDVTVEATGPDGAAVSYDTPAATDDTDPAPVVACSPASGTQLALGDSTVACTATDASGNTADATFTVHVVDTTPPALALPAGLSAEATGPAGAAVSWSDSATDIVDGVTAVTCDAASGSTFAVGTTTVTCSSTDAHGNTGTGSFDVTVVDTTPPTLTLPADKTVDATSPAGATVTFSTSATDIVDGATSVTCSPASGSTFAIGTTTVTCSSTDAHGNTATASFSVHVRSAAEMTALFCPSLVGVGPGTSLYDKCMDAVHYIAIGDTTDAVATLKAFDHEVAAQRGKKLTAVKAAALTARADAIIAVLGG